ncbi:exodeoxyribonuclease V subunit beta [Variovorax sp. J22R133]|uniref:exodeoxyribonuclease V subunit beta n=1 Tax=Variovorax brevis TaxID=3053503 RepID=UPI0025785CAF|nr:exodeoxyribonuclease V subunit beta [Variovorax sp. J22R133]MDM0112039.1 exodeoxyribonuclease V subunit beta [Variovorax sp. J22R133]
MSSAKTPPVLQPLSFPLRGSRLIEASAGTGKTFTIAALYLRLVLGHGGPAAFSRALTPPEILVVTFTEAATKELRDRIRARLAEAAEAFAVDADNVQPKAPGQDLLHDLRDSYPATEWLACARALRLAAEWMDEAAVSTIHGWCNRMLREHAFDSGALFTQTLEADQAELRAEVLRDYWRSFFTPLSLDEARQVHEWWATPAALLESANKLLGLTHSMAPGTPPAIALRAAREQAERELAQIKAPWAAWIEELQALLDKAVAGKQVDGRKLQTRHYQPWLDALRLWASSDAQQPPLDKGSKAWTRLTPEGMAEAFNKGVPAPDHPAFDDMQTLRARLAALPDAHDDVLRHAVHWAAARLATEQARRAQMGFDELLTRLDAALQGPNGRRLAELIRTQFPVALIDEFQDTDPLQYRIFNAVYNVAANAQDTALVLIGDPKQAIYAFRGADIYTYLGARRDTADRHATLGMNFRSTGAMVGAVNRVFMQAEERDAGQGAFLFRSPSDNPLPFIAVDAKGRDERWVDGDAPAPALTCWTVATDQPIGSGEAQVLMSAACATEIVRLLAEAQAGRAGFAGDGHALRPVKPGDIAVLVNSGREAAIVRQALTERNVRSVYLSDREFVFQSPVAADLQRLLLACAEPDDDRPLRAALSTAVLALDWPELDRLNHDELAWEARVLQFRRYRQTWRRQGVLPMLRHLLQDFDVPQRLLAETGGERKLTDLLHLAELLQQASVQVEGEHGLIRWLAEQRSDSESENDARKLRLESDADLVKVVTVHKSKGLEYPLVFLPFASAFRPARGDDPPFKWHDDSGRLIVALSADDEAVERVDRERLGEDLRKLYVALTRARYATWMGVAPLAAVQDSAIGYLLSGGEALSPSALNDALEAMARSHDAIAVQPAPEARDARYQPRDPELEPAPEPPLPTGPRENWWIASYSALRRDDIALAGDEAPVPVAMQPSPATAAEDIYAESRAAAGAVEQDASPVAVDEGGGLHGFPRGAAPGSFLHGLLEWAGRKGFARLHSDAEAQADLADLIARRCNLNGWSNWIEPLRTWMQSWLSTPLQLDALHGKEPVAVSPSSLRHVQIEMEFWLAAQNVDTLALDALVTRHTLGGVPRPALQPQQVNGMLKGFIDLVFEHEGRYYVADYKSNWLGPRDADYTVAAMRDAVLHHRYELQYVLYVFALHRLLRSRLPDYDYERHIGGAVYLFLRGHAAPGQGLHCERPPKALIESLDALFSATVATATNRGVAA